MCPQAEREPLSSVVNSLQTTLGMLLCSGSKLSCTRQHKISEIFLHIQSSGLGSMKAPSVRDRGQDKEFPDVPGHLATMLSS